MHLQSNLKKTKLIEQANVLCQSYQAALRQLSEGDPFTIIFLDPPYQMGGEEALLQGIVEQGLLAEGGIVVLEAANSKTIEADAIRPLVVTRQKKYKTNQHIFFEEGR